MLTGRGGVPRPDAVLLSGRGRLLPAGEGVVGLCATRLAIVCRSSRGFLPLGNSLPRRGLQEWVAIRVVALMATYTSDITHESLDQPFVNRGRCFVEGCLSRGGLVPGVDRAAVWRDIDLLGLREAAAAPAWHDRRKWYTAASRSYHFDCGNLWDAIMSGDQPREFVIRLQDRVLATHEALLRFSAGIFDYEPDLRLPGRGPKPAIEP